MKKVVIGVIVVLIAAIIGIYLFIPQTISISRVIKLPIPATSVSRHVDPRKWHLWWSGEVMSPPGRFLFDERYYNPVSNEVFDFLQVRIDDKDHSVNSTMKILSLAEKSSSVVWNLDVKTGNNIFRRIRMSGRANDLSEDMQLILEKLKKYLSDEKNVYQLDIKETRVKDTAFISTRSSYDHYPTTEEVYQLINPLHDYVKRNAAQETDLPMMHLQKTGPNSYDLMVAIPVNKILPETNQFVVKRMILGKILVAEVRGGRSRIDEGMQEMENYVKDHKLVSPAIPFEMIITNRQVESDTSKWVTRLYYPIF